MLTRKHRAKVKTRLRDLMSAIGTPVAPPDPLNGHDLVLNPDVMQVRVSKENIEEACTGLAQKCMIAAAIKEADPGVSYVSVRTNGITVTKRNADGCRVRSRWAVSNTAARNIVRWDKREPVRPFVFFAKLIEARVIPPAQGQEKQARAARAQARRDLIKSGVIQPRKHERSRVMGV